jgi:hypothetical protein
MRIHSKPDSCLDRHTYAEGENHETHLDHSLHGRWKTEGIILPKHIIETYTGIDASAHQVPCQGKKCAGKSPSCERSSNNHAKTLL